MTETRQGCVIAIRSISRSGSSLLGLLLDSIKGVTAPGELINLYQALPDNRIPCVTCHPRECGFYRSVRRASFYADIAALYGCRVLVDSSRVNQYYLEREQQHRGRLFNIVLYKRPHEYLSTWKLYGAEEVFRTWARKYQALPDNAFLLEYRTLAGQVDRTLRRIAAWVGLMPFSRRNDWWTTETHVVGANEAIQHQINREIHPRLDPKYLGREEQVFLDEAWKNDTQFKSEMRKLYLRDAYSVSTSLRNLGTSIEEQIEDLNTSVRGN